MVTCSFLQKKIDHRTYSISAFTALASQEMLCQLPNYWWGWKWQSCSLAAMMNCKNLQGTFHVMFNKKTTSPEEATDPLRSGRVGSFSRATIVLLSFIMLWSSVSWHHGMAAFSSAMSGLQIWNDNGLLIAIWLEIPFWFQESHCHHQMGTYRPASWPSISFMASFTLLDRCSCLISVGLFRLMHHITQNREHKTYFE